MYTVRYIVIFSFILTIYGLSVCEKNASIVIIGTGAAAITVATFLLKHDFNNIKLLEAEDRIGGRIHSVKFGDAYVELGAEFCNGENANIVYSLVKEYNILKHSNENDSWIIYRSNGEKLDTNLSQRILNLADSFDTDEEIRNCENVESIGKCVDIKARIAISNFPNGTKEAEVMEDAVDWVKVSLSSYDGPLDLYDLNITTNYVDCDGDLWMTWNGLGYKTVLDVLMEKYPDRTKPSPIDNKIFLNKTVTSITGWNLGDQVLVTTSDGEEYRADHVIFTPSLGVLKADYDKLFKPSLNQEKIDAIKQMGFGAMVNVIMHFPQKWWSDPVSAYSLIWTKADKKELKEKNLSWLINLGGVIEAENNPNVLIAWYAGEHVPDIEQLSDEDLLKGHIYMVKKFSLSKDFDVTLPDKIIRSDWYTNPHFRGSYSYESVREIPGKSPRKQLAAPLMNENGIPTVLFAGEATHSKYFSSVHGAIETGFREGHRILKLYK